MRWQYACFSELPIADWYAATMARESVFVVEQQCPFLDADGADPECWHLIGWDTHEGKEEVACYSRIVPPGLKYAEPSIGRVLTTKNFRKNGTGRALMQESIARVEAQFPGQPIRIGAQQYLEKFYGSFGFETVSEPYDEDGIMHVIMLRAGSSA